MSKLIGITIMILFLLISSAHAITVNLLATPIYPTSIELIWTTDIHPTKVFSWEVFRSLDGIDFVNIKTYRGDRRRYLDSELLPATQYYYKVKVTYFNSLDNLATAESK